MNRIILITGATSGIGKACSEKFAANGDSLIINGRRKERLSELKNDLEKRFKINVFTAAFDVQNRESVFSAINNLPEKWQKIDVLINNAGLALGRDFFDEANLDDWEIMLQTNVNGLVYVTKAILPFMVKRNEGHVINLGSVAAKEVYEKGNIYCASKYAVDAISRSMRIDLLRHNIKVTAIHPGAVETEFSLVRFNGNENEAKKIYNGYAPLTPEDVAASIFYCASLPPNVCINDLVITALAQANSVYFNKK